MVVMIAASTLFLFFGHIGNKRFSRQQKSSNARSVLKRCSHHFGWINNARNYKITVLLFVGVVSVVLSLHLSNAIDDNRSIDTGVGGNCLKRISQSIFNDQCSEFFIA